MFAPNTPPADNAFPAEGGGVPRELKKIVLPPYVIEPPDLLVIEAIHVVPKQPYHLQPFDTIAIQAAGTPVEAPLSSIFPIGADGAVTLGPHYGTVNLLHKTVNEAKDIIVRHLSTTLVNPEVSVALVDSAARQRISGPHLVAMDGTVTLGSYGCVSVVGLTVPEAKQAVQKYLLQFFDSLEVSLEVNGFNSKIYYIVTQGAGLGDGVYRQPITGNETVLDAISQINGLQRVSSKKIWIARPTDTIGSTQRLEVSWEDITANANARTNYQILPGDRVFIAQDELIAADTAFGKVIAPVERVLGFSLLGVGTVTRFSGHVLNGGGNPQGTF
ncbi:MAG: polysaccharide biosynthesis/export family protein [Thermoguttaceae bacterium]